MKIRKNVRSVYLILNEENKRVKIGYSGNPKKRFQAIMTQSGCKMRLYHYTKPIDNYADVEKWMHDLFHDRRGIGEWFDGVNLNVAVKNLIFFASKGQVCRIVKMYEDGKNATYISSVLKVSRSGVLKYLTAVGCIDKDETLFFSKPMTESVRIPAPKNKIKKEIEEDFAKKFDEKLREGLNDNYVEQMQVVVKKDTSKDPSDFKGFTKGDIAEMVRKNNLKLGRTKTF
jgi:hypothetical protein